jgi:peptidoglycan hydrolase CwlO-like protein
MKTKVIIIFIIIICISSIVLAHQGRTDKYGGHYNHSTGTYHYHSGKYANTGEYTKPIEEGGVAIGKEPTVVWEDENGNQQSLVITDSYDENLDKINKLEDEKEELKEEIYDLQKKIEDLQEKIDNKESEITDLWVMFITMTLIGIFISYNIGKNKKD